MHRDFRQSCPSPNCESTTLELPPWDRASEPFDCFLREATGNDGHLEAPSITRQADTELPQFNLPPRRRRQQHSESPLSETISINRPPTGSAHPSHQDAHAGELSPSNSPLEMPMGSHNPTGHRNRSCLVDYKAVSQRHQPQQQIHPKIHWPHHY